MHIKLDWTGSHDTVVFFFTPVVKFQDNKGKFKVYCAQKETHIFNVAISNELFDWNTPHIA